MQEVCVAHRVGWLLMLLLARVVVHAAHLVGERAVPVLEFVQEVERRLLLALVAEHDLAQAALIHVAHAVQNSTRKHQQHPSSPLELFYGPTELYDYLYAYLSGYRANARPRVYMCGRELISSHDLAARRLKCFEQLSPGIADELPTPSALFET